ncbi:MAG: MATE family efflux transporter [Dehalobacterium sp.]
MDHSKQLGEDNILQLLLKFSIPAIVGMLVQALYNVVDRIFIGQGVGSLGIAGVTIGFPIMIVMMAFGMLVGIGTTSLISLRLGEQKKDEAELIMANGMVLLIVISLALSLLGLVFLNPLLKLFGASSDVLPYAGEYLSIILLGGLFQGIGFGMNNFIRAEGNPRMAMMTMLIGAILNIILDPIFIFTFDWGIRGAALATIISQGISSAWVLYYFLGGKSLLKIRVHYFSLQASVVGQIFLIGSAPFAMQLAASILNAILNKSLVVYGGDVAVSAMGVVNSVAMLILMPIFGLNQGAQPIIGYNYGAGNFERVKETVKLAVTAATAFVIVGFFVVEMFPESIIRLFNREDLQLIELGAHALQVFLIALPIIGFQIVSANYFQAVGKPKQAMILSLSRQVLVLIPAVLILPRFFELNGILYAGPLSDVISSIITGVWIFQELKSLDQKQQEKLAFQPQ